MRSILLVDIDHTLMDAYWRDSMIGAIPSEMAASSWDDYHAASVNDLPIESVVAFVNTLSANGWEAIGLTMRPEKWRQVTMRTLIKHDVKLDEIIMRETMNWGSSKDEKLRLAKEWLGEPFSEHLVILIEDRDDVIAAFKAEGVTCLQVHHLGAKRS